MWKVTYTKNTDNEKIGSVTATHTDAEGKVFTFSSDRINTDNITTFISQAKQGLLDKVTEDSKYASIASKIEQALNS